LFYINDIIHLIIMAQILSDRYYCDLCNYATDYNSLYNEHMLSTKHLIKTCPCKKLLQTCVSYEEAMELKNKIWKLEEENKMLKQLLEYSKEYKLISKQLSISNKNLSAHLEITNNTNYIEYDINNDNLVKTFEYEYTYRLHEYICQLMISNLDEFENEFYKTHPQFNIESKDLKLYIRIVEPFLNYISLKITDSIQNIKYTYGHAKNNIVKKLKDFEVQLKDPVFKNLIYKTLEYMLIK